MTISNIDEGAIEYITPEGSLLGFPTGINTKRFSNADTISIRKSEGIVITGSGKTISWPIVRFVEHEGKMVALGPWIENSKPFETESINHGMISRLLPAIQALKSADYPLSGLYSRAVRWLPDGGVLIYPPKLAAWMSELNLESEHWVHPDRTAEPAWSFSLGVLTWQALTGTDPFADETGEFRRERIRKRILPPMNTLVPGINKAAEAIIRKSLIGDENGMITTLEEWESFIQLWQNEGIISNLPESELQERRARAARKALSIEKKLKAQRWFRLSGWKFLVSVAVTFGILAFTSAPIKKALEAPATIGMMP
ncbi:MAG: hypothetical protein KAH21_00945, partial [Spirochaetaceae bacterium]|nr:hypothetical protein [Spirochaetaceae bacterium]